MQQPIVQRLYAYLARRWYAVIVLISLCVWLGLAAYGTESPRTRTDAWTNRWLQGVPCRAPCWEGITVGKTTADQAVNLLQQSPLIRSAELITSSIAPHMSEVDWTWNDGYSGGRAFYDSQTAPYTIDTIQVQFLTSVKLQDVIKAYGNPSHVIATASQGGFIGESAPELLSYSLIIVYMNHGFYLSANIKEKPTINADLNVGNPTFFPPQVQLPPTRFTLNPPQEFVPWQGYQKFEWYCRDQVSGRACRATPPRTTHVWLWLLGSGALIMLVLWMVWHQRRESQSIQQKH